MGKHVFGLDEVVGHADHAIQPFDIGGGAYQERWQFVGLVARNFNELSVSNYIHIHDPIYLIDDKVAYLH